MEDEEFLLLRGKYPSWTAPTISKEKEMTAATVINFLLPLGKKFANWAIDTLIEKYNDKKKAKEETEKLFKP
jgi:hypothetical protein